MCETGCTRKQGGDMTQNAEQVVPWQGLNHLALITNDMDTTVRFWHGVHEGFTGRKPLVRKVTHT